MKTDIKHTNSIICNDVYVKPLTKGLAHEFYSNYVKDSSLLAEGVEYEEYIYNYDNLEDYLISKTRNGEFCYAVLFNNDVVGEISLKDFDLDSCEIEIILKNDSYKNVGIGSKALEIITLIAEVDYHIKTLKAAILKSDSRSIHVFEKLGFSFYKSNALFGFYKKILKNE